MGNRLFNFSKSESNCTASIVALHDKGMIASNELKGSKNLFQKLFHTPDCCFLHFLIYFLS